MRGRRTDEDPGAVPPPGAMAHPYPSAWVLNPHPALSPSFPGMRGPQEALDYGVKVTGCTLFVIDGGVDTGPIVVQLQGPSVEYEGVYVSDALLERLQVGTTTADWVTAVLGEPTSRTTLGDGSEIWKWTYRPIRHQTSLISLLGQGDEEEPNPNPVTAFVRLKDGVVVEKWRG